MTPQEIIYDVLKNDTKVIEIIGSDNVYPLVAAQKKQLPLLTFQFSKLDTTPSKVVESHLDIHFLDMHIFSENYGECVLLSNHLRSKLSAKSIEVIDEELITHTIDFCRLRNIEESYKSDAEVYSLSISFDLLIFK